MKLTGKSKMKLGGKYALATGWDVKKQRSVLVSRTIEGKKYYMLSLRQGMTLVERCKLAEDIRSNGKYSARLVKVAQRYEVFVLGRYSLK